MILSKIYLKHWIKFPYDTSESSGKIGSHYVFSIKNSIHYKCLQSQNFEDYEKLILSTNQKEHSVKSFIELSRNFSIQKIGKIKIEYSKPIDKFLVNDGCHRLAIILYKQIFQESIPDQYITYE